MSSINTLKVASVVIREETYKEYDKLFTLFTKDFGKIRAYAFGVRREHSKKIGALRLFSFVEVTLENKNDSYTIIDAKVLDGFEGFTKDYEITCYAAYFVELIDYFSYENMESENVFRLLYYTFKALSKGNINCKLIKSIYELKMLKYQGEYVDSENLKNKNATVAYTWDRVLTSDPKELYTFKLEEDIFKIFRNEVDREFRQKVDKKFKSLESIGREL